MSANVGTVDRIVRVLIGVAALVFAFVLGPYVASGAWGWERIVLAVVGVMMLLTSAVRICPLYSILGVRT